jgi:GTPase SAR1 family protein
MIDAGSVDGASANDSAEVYPQPHAGLSDAGVGHSRVPGLERCTSPPGQTAKPINCLVVGMAGSGKSSLVSRLVSHANEKQWAWKAINLDPAVQTLSFPADLDIRDTVSYSRVMEEYRLGPNGAILTALNLFAAQFERVLDFIESACGPSRENATANESDQVLASSTAPRFIFFDTPGQIEAFTWSASGMIVTETLAAVAEYPTVLLYVVDIPRCVQNVLTFTSNMLYACSMLYRSRIPLLVLWNKCDCVSREEADRLGTWMHDFEAFDAALEAGNEASRTPGGGDYAVSFSRSLALALNEFYQQVPCVFVSATTGEGMDRLFESLEHARIEYERSEYLQQVRQRKRERTAAEERRLERERHRFRAAHRSTGDGDSNQAGASATTEATSRDRLRMRLQRAQRNGYHEHQDASPNEDESEMRRLAERFSRTGPRST